MGGSVKEASQDRISGLAYYCVALVNVHLLVLGTIMAAIMMGTSTPPVFRFCKVAAFMQRISGAGVHSWSCMELVILQETMPIVLKATMTFHDMTVQKAQHGASIARIAWSSHLTTCGRSGLVRSGQIVTDLQLGLVSTT